MNRSRHWQLLPLLCGLIMIFHSASIQAGEISLTKIFDDGKYNSFTDLCKFKGHYYCTFRSAISHGGASHQVMGEIVVIRSADKTHWSEVARFRQENVDLRDPKLLATPDSIRVYAVDCRFRPGGKIEYANRCWSSQEGSQWKASQVMAPGYIFWRPKFYKGKFYVPAYARRPGYCCVDLLVSDDGEHWHVQSTPVPPAQVEEETLWANETELLFLENGTALLFARRNYSGKPNPELKKFGGFRSGVVLQADARTLTNWKKIDEGTMFHCPAALEHQGRIFLAGRDKYPLPNGRFTETARLWEFIPGKGFTELVHFKTRGDCSYPGIVAEGNELLVTYFSTHEGKTAYFELPGKADVYLSRITLAPNK